MPRVKITYSPSGDPKVGSIMQVSDKVAITMIKTGRAEMHTDAPQAAGTTTTGDPGPVGLEILSAAGPTGATVEGGAVVATQPPESQNQPDQPSAAEPAPTADSGPATPASKGTAKS